MLILLLSPTVWYADCKELFNAGYRISGVYDIKPPGSKESFPVYCDQQTAIKGWTVIQKRFNGSVIFSNRTWAEYRNGFGSLTGEFWLGLDKIHILTKTPTRIRFDLGTPDGVNKFAAYQGFTITGDVDKYRLTTGRFIGNYNLHDGRYCTDEMMYEMNYIGYISVIYTRRRY